jgi:hypothetical protein
MSIERLISCLQPGTSLSEQGKTVSITRRNNEIVLMFATDSQLVRDVLNVARVCDAVFLYMQYLSRPILIFVELKGKNVKDAADQISSTIRGVRTLLNRSVRRNFPERADLRAVVVRSGSAPQNQQEIVERFLKETGVRLYLVRERGDLRNYLRNL